MEGWKESLIMIVRLEVDDWPRPPIRVPVEAIQILSRDFNSTEWRETDSFEF
jgi:hypothetical protein